MQISIMLNGESRQLDAGTSITALIATLDLEKGRLAVERNREIVPKSQWDETLLTDGDELEMVHFVGGGEADAAATDSWTVAGRTFASRLIIGTGKYKDYALNAAAAEASGAEMVTVALRRVNLTDRSKPVLSDYVRPDQYTYLPNTAGCYTADDALRTLRLAREAGGWTLVKLEILADPKTLYPDVIETVRACDVLTKEGFEVMAYTSDDPAIAKRLEDAGAKAVMPLGAPIGSGLGIRNPINIRLIVEAATVPIVVDAGVGTASDAAIAMELGADAVLMNTAIAEAKDPVRMARAMKAAVRAGRDAYLAGRMPVRRYADPSSPLAGLI